MILNPASAAGATGRRRREVLQTIESVLGRVDLAVTSGPGDATRLAEEATERGVSRILVAGGDGTASEIVSGVLARTISTSALGRPRPTLGLLPLGSGWDLARSLALPRNLDAALALIQQGVRRRIDAGRLEYRDATGRPASRFFVNEASAGLSGATVQVVGRLAKRVGAKLGFAAGAIAVILSHRPAEVAIEVDGERIYEGPISLVVAANGCYFGAGMKVAPNARLDDGRLEIAIVRGLSVPRLLVNLPSLYLGRHGRHPSVSFHAARTVEVLPKDASVPIDLDGEAVGRLPMRAEVLPGALEVFAGVVDSRDGRA